MGALCVLLAAAGGALLYSGVDLTLSVRDRERKAARRVLITTAAGFALCGLALLLLQGRL